MKKKILFVTFLCMLAGMSAFSQVKLGIKGGINFADLKYEPQDQTHGIPDANSLPSYHLGVIVDLPLASMLSLQPGVFYTGKGSKLKYSGDNWDFTQTMNPTYIEVPVNILFKPTIGANTKFYVGAGPYIAKGVGGQVSYDGNLGDISGHTDHDIKFGNSSDDDLKSTDIGANVLAGFEFSNGLLLGAQYGMSFTNNAPKGENSDTKILRNKVLGISLGFLF